MKLFVKCAIAVHFSASLDVLTTLPCVWSHPSAIVTSTQCILSHIFSVMAVTHITVPRPLDSLRIIRLVMVRAVQLMGIGVLGGRSMCPGQIRHSMLIVLSRVFNVHGYYTIQLKYMLKLCNQFAKWFLKRYPMGSPGPHIHHWFEWKLKPPRQQNLNESLRNSLDML